MKKTVFFLAVLSCFFFTVAASAALILEYDGGVHNYSGAIYRLSVNGRDLTNLPLDPIIFNDRALVPVREVFEALGATVSYDGETKKVTVAYKNNIGVIQIDSNYAEINGVGTSIPDGITPKLIAKWGEPAKTMIPVRFVSDGLGLFVYFDAGMGRIDISTERNLPEFAQSNITKISEAEENGVVTVMVTTDTDIINISSPAVTESGVLYVDIKNMGYKTDKNKSINLGAVQGVRLGRHSESTRIAIDTRNMQRYNVGTVGNSIIFKISGDPNANVDIAAGSGTENYSANVNVDVQQRPLYVVLDAGHGGSDPGAIGNLMTEAELEAYHQALAEDKTLIDSMPAGTGGVCNEKSINFSVMNRVREKLAAYGVNVVVTRDTDSRPSLDERAELANRIGAAVFLSIHVNSTVNPVTSAQGMEIMYCESNNGDEYGVTSKEMASIILNKTTSVTGARSRGVKAGNLAVTKKTVMPANLLEIGFINNPDELSLMLSEEYQEKIATGITEGILEVLGRIKMP